MPRPKTIETTRRRLKLRQLQAADDRICSPDHTVTTSFQYTYETWMPSEADSDADPTPWLQCLDVKIQGALTNELNAQYNGMASGICSVQPQPFDSEDECIEECIGTHVYPNCESDSIDCGFVCEPILGSALVTYDPDILSIGEANIVVQSALKAAMLDDRLAEGCDPIVKLVYADRSHQPTSDDDGQNTTTRAETIAEKSMDDPSDDGGVPPVAIAGSLLGFLAFLCLVFFLAKCRRRKQESDDDEEGEGTTAGGKAVVPVDGEGMLAENDEGGDEEGDDTSSSDGTNSTGSDLDNCTAMSEIAS